MLECALVTALSDEQVWDYLEGNLEPEFVQFIRVHCLWCRNCLDFFGDALERIQTADPKRYSLYHRENFAVRKAELARFCRRHGIEIDLTQLTDPSEYCKYAIGAILKEYAPRFHDMWDKASDSQRSEMMLEILQCIEEMRESG